MMQKKNESKKSKQNETEGSSVSVRNPNPYLALMPLAFVC